MVILCCCCPTGSVGWQYVDDEISGAGQRGADSNQQSGAVRH